MGLWIWTPRKQRVAAPCRSAEAFRMPGSGKLTPGGRMPGMRNASALQQPLRRCHHMLQRTASSGREPPGRQETLSIVSTLPPDIARARSSRAAERPVRAGVIGCGSFGSGILAQAASVPLLEIPAVADRSLDTARRAYFGAGVPDEAVVVCDSHRAAMAAIEAGKRVIAADPMLLMELPLDVIAEATGQPEGGARHAEAAIRHGKHVAMVTKEADVTVGPMLNRLAEEAGVVYTPVDGDQHGLLIERVAWARRLGLEVLCGGKARDQEILCDRRAGTLSG